MKKILIGVLIILLCVMAYFAIFNGLSLGSVEILSVSQINEENKKLTQAIRESEKLMQSDYPTKTDELEKNVDSLLRAKEEYNELASISTEGELSKANREETYKIEYLWTRIGSHATAEGINLKFDVSAGDSVIANAKNLAFTVTGNYIAIINFISSLEDDSQLTFKIENFKMLPGGDNSARQATFVVRNIKVKLENITSNVDTTKTETDAGTNTELDENTNVGTNTELDQNTNTDNSTEGTTAQ